jgi:hypothetical protein
VGWVIFSLFPSSSQDIPISSHNVPQVPNVLLKAFPTASHFLSGITCPGSTSRNINCTRRNRQGENLLLLITHALRKAYLAMVEIGDKLFLKCKFNAARERRLTSTGGRVKFFFGVGRGGGARGWRFLFIVYSQCVPINFPMGFPRSP